MSFGFTPSPGRSFEWAPTRRESPEPQEWPLEDLLLAIESTDEQVRCKAMDRITKLLEHAHGEQGSAKLLESVERQLVPALFQMAAHCPAGGEDSHFCSEMNAVAALCLVAGGCERHERAWLFDGFLPAFSALLVHSSSMVRKLSLTHLAALGDRFGDAFTRAALLPHFVAGCADENYRVRKVCAEQFGRLAARASPESRRSELTAAFLRLLNDSHKLVHMAAAHQLGPFVATFADARRTGLELRDGRVVRRPPPPVEPPADEGEVPPDPENRPSSDEPVPSLWLECADDAEDTRRAFDSSLASSASSLSSTAAFLREVGGEERRFERPPVGFRMPWDAKTRPAARPFDSETEESDGDADEPFGRSFGRSRAPLAIDEEEDEESPLDCSFRDDDELDEEGDSPFDPNAAHMPPLDFRELEAAEEPPVWERVQADFLALWDAEGEKEEVVEHVEECWALIPADSPLLAVGLPARPPTRLQPGPASPPALWRSPGGLPRGVVRLERKESPTTLAIRAAFADDQELEAWAEEAEAAAPRRSPAAPQTPPGRKAPPSPQSPLAVLRLPAGSSPLARRLSPTSVAIAAADGAEATEAMVDAQLSPQPAGESSGGWASVFRNVKSSAAGFVQQWSSLKALPGGSGASPSALLSSLKLQPTARPADAPRSPVRPRRLFGSPKRVASSVLPAESPKQPKRARQSGVKPRPPTPPLMPAITREFPPIGEEGVRRFLTPAEQAAYFAGAQDAIPQPLLDSLQTFQAHDAHEPTDQHNAILAHAFPAIAFTFGAERWLFVKAIFLSLAASHDAAVRATIARSLHEVAAIVGEERATRDLVPVFARLADDEPDVQAGLFPHLAAFFRAVHEQRRPELAARLACFNTVEGHWRRRHEFIQQLSLMVELFKPYPANEFLVPFALSFATGKTLLSRSSPSVVAERTAEVRRAAVNLLAALLAMFVAHEHEAARAAGRPPDAADSRPLTEGLLRDCARGFADSKSWRNRQSFAMLMEALLRRELLDAPLFTALFKDRLRAVSLDGVRNVRQFFCSIVRLLRAARVRQPVEDAEWAAFERERLHTLAAGDEDLEIKLQARIALGTLEPHADELDLSARVLPPAGCAHAHESTA